MKRFFVIVGVVFLLLSCDNDRIMNNGTGEDPDKGPFSFIGTWEAEGEYTHPTAGKWTYKDTITFLNETDYTEIINKLSKNDGRTLFSEHKGTYIREEESYITYTDVYRTSPDGEFPELPYIYTKVPYKFIDRNTLEHYAPGSVSSEYVKNLTYNKK